MKRIVILPVALAALLTGGCWQLNLAWRSTTVQTYARDRDGAITASNGVKGGADIDATIPPDAVPVLKAAPTSLGVVESYVAPQPAPPMPASPTYYVVERGDTLSALARRWGTTAGAIRAANPEIRNKNMIRIGQRVWIP